MQFNHFIYYHNMIHVSCSILVIGSICSQTVNNVYKVPRIKTEEGLETDTDMHENATDMIPI